MRLKSTPSRFRVENNSALESRSDGLAPDLAEVHRPVEGDGGFVSDCDVQGEPRLVATREPPHRGLQQGSPKPTAAAVLRDTELRDERHAHPVRDQNRAHDSVAL